MSASIERIEGVVSADLNFASGTLLVEFESGSDPRAAVERAVSGSGHLAVSLDDVDTDAEAQRRPLIDRYRAEIAAIGGGTFAAIGAVLELAGAPSQLAVAAFAVSIVFGGLLVWRRALAALAARRVEMNVLMTIAVFGAAALGEWGEAATVYFLFSLGGLLEARSLERTRRSIRDLMELAPPTARVLDEGVATEVRVEEVSVGQVVEVRPGDRVPLDGVVSEGASAVDEAQVTGESTLAEKSPGDPVWAGSLNTNGVLLVRVTARSEDSTLARVVYMVEEAQASKAPVQRLVDRFSAYYTPTVVAAAALIAVVPPLAGVVFGLPVGGFSEWIQRALVMLVVSCPCALVISTPVSIVSAITRASRDGVLVKGGAFLEVAANVDAVAFDKTGTLTLGRPRVAEVIALGHGTGSDALAIAAALEKASTHPVARAIVEAFGSTPGRARDVTETPGVGVSGVIGDATWRIGGPTLLDGDPESAAAHSVASLEELGQTALVLMRETVPVAVFGIEDEVRPEASAVIDRLGSLGITSTVMLTGDNERTAEAVAQRVGVKGFLARLLPEGKTDAVRVLQQRYGTVAMVGDGINDAPALAAADVGVAMGGAGSATALETADVALMADDLHALPRFFALGSRTVRIIWQNVVFSIVVKFVVLALAVMGVATLWMAVFADTGVSLLVILNGMRLLRRRA